jgi:hypothetical protein
MDRIYRVHSPVADLLFSGHGHYLTTCGSLVMVKILMYFANSGKPALAFRNSILCKASDEEFAKHVMEKAYTQLFYYGPVIKKVF